MVRSVAGIVFPALVIFVVGSTTNVSSFWALPTRTTRLSAAADFTWPKAVNRFAGVGAFVTGTAGAAGVLGAGVCWAATGTAVLPSRAITPIQTDRRFIQAPPWRLASGSKRTASSG